MNNGLGKASTSLQMGIDAFLLVAYVLSNKSRIKKFVELGIGQGLASCTLALQLSNTQGFGIDIEERAIEIATSKAINLQLKQQLKFVLASVEQPKEVLRLYKQCMGTALADIIMANPPYHKYASGRLSKDNIRCKALHQDSKTLEYFCACANALLKYHGYFFCIYNPKYMHDLFKALAQYNFGIRQILNIHSRKNCAAKWVLIKAQKQAKDDIEILPSLSLYHDNKTKKLSQEILSFCPWIKAE